MAVSTASTASLSTARQLAAAVGLSSRAAMFERLASAVSEELADVATTLQGN